MTEKQRMQGNEYELHTSANGTLCNAMTDPSKYEQIHLSTHAPAKELVMGIECACLPVMTCRLRSRYVKGEQRRTLLGHLYKVSS
jgi:hypothetical protein